MTDWVSTKAAMKLFGVGSTTIKRWADEKKLRSFRTAGGHRRFAREDIERYFEELSSGEPYDGDENNGDEASAP